MEFKHNNGIILSLDVLNKDLAYTLLDKVYDLIVGIKVNQVLLFQNGISICNEIKNRYNLPIIGDFKIADVNVTNRNIVDISLKNSIDYLTVHGFIGLKNLDHLKKYAGERIRLFMITEFTSCTSEVLLDFQKNAELARDLGFFGVQAPATKPKIIKEVRDIVGNSMIIISCGVGKQGGKVGNAIKHGADYEIVGRNIYLSDTPRETTKEFVELIEGLIT